MTHPAPKAPKEPEPDDDLHDPRDRAAPFPLGEYLRICDPCAEAPGSQPCLRQDFDDTDRKAKDGQTAYAKVARKAAILGLFALLVGLGQHLFHPFAESKAEANPLFLAEVVYTVYALGLVLVAIVTRKQERWLIERFKAERLRLLKFKFLIDPTLWQATRTDLSSLRDRLETERGAIVNQSVETLDALKVSDALPDLPPTNACIGVEVPALQRLLEYYRRKRLGYQLSYFAEKIKKPRYPADNPLLPPIFFFFGIALVLCNLVLEWATKGAQNDRIGSASQVLVFASFAVPLGWSAIRTFRGAHEFSRNQARSHARHTALSEIARSLNAATAAPADQWDRPVIFGYLYLCEGILASDQHEWIRLMKDAEWYG